MGFVSYTIFGNDHNLDMLSRLVHVLSRMAYVLEWQRVKVKVKGEHRQPERQPGSHWYCSQVSRRKAAANSTTYQLQASTKTKRYRT
jgi:hypothetical protein